MDEHRGEVKQHGGWCCRYPLPRENVQIPSNLVAKSQATDIIDLIVQFIRHQNGVHRSCRNRTSRGAVLSTSEVQWATTKFDGVWHALLLHELPKGAWFMRICAPIS